MQEGATLQRVFHLLNQLPNLLHALAEIVVAVADFFGDLLQQRPRPSRGLSNVVKRIQQGMQPALVVGFQARMAKQFDDRPVFRIAGWVAHAICIVLIGRFAVRMREQMAISRKIEADARNRARA
jgi:hypothetical protein